MDRRAWEKPHLQDNQISRQLVWSHQGQGPWTTGQLWVETKRLIIHQLWFHRGGGGSQHALFSPKHRTTFKIFYCFKIYIDLKSQKIISLVEQPQAVCGSIFQQEVKQTRRKPGATGNRSRHSPGTLNAPAVHTAPPRWPYWRPSARRTAVCVASRHLLDSRWITLACDLQLHFSPAHRLTKCGLISTS